MRTSSTILPFLAAIVLTAVAPSTSRAQSIITVNTTYDPGLLGTLPPPGQCTLRDAITAANTNLMVRGCAAGQSGRDIIKFKVGNGTPTIWVQSELPVILEPIEIDGATGGADRVELNGSNAVISLFPLRRGRVNGDGLILAAQDSTIRSLVIGGFLGNGIVMTSITGGYLPDHTPPTISDPTIRTDPPCDVRPGAECISRGPGGTGDPDEPGGGSGTRNRIFGCYIGTDRTGTLANGNGSGVNAAGLAENAGIVTDTDMHIIGGPTVQERNVISGNFGHGLILGGRGHLVRGNLIGLNVNGAALANQFDGINVAGGQFSNATGTIGASQSAWDGKCRLLIDSNGWVVDEARSCGNQIAFNGRYGIVTGYNSYQVLSNSIFSNGDLGMDVDTPGVTPNDPAGSDRNYPVWIWSMPVLYLNPPAFGTKVRGSITNWSNTPVIIQIFHGAACDPSGHGEGLELVRTFTVPGNGNFTFSIPRQGGFLTATSTPKNVWGSKATSEFAACLAI
jgi:hypothetical protein